MIASDRCARRVGKALLVVDGDEETLVRKAKISIRPTRGQAYALERGLLQLSCDAYNAALEHRREAWRLAGVSISTFDQFKEIDDELRACRPEVARYGIQPVRSAIRRVDEAMAAFFRRVRNGQTPGYPRFKSRERFRTVLYDGPYSWKLRHLEDVHPTLYIQGIGEIVLSDSAARQLLRLLARGGEPRTLAVTKTRTGAWRAVVGFRGVTQRRLEDSSEVGGIDRGIAVTAALPDGTLLKMPGFLDEARREIKELQHRRAWTTKGSQEWRRISRRIAKIHRKAHHQSENWARHVAGGIVARYGVIALEKLDLTSMTRSAKGTKEKPGTNVKAKSGLNRSLRDAALGQLGLWICVKAEEAGRRVWKVDASHSSQCCVVCGHTEKENRRGPHFACLSCGHSAHADVNAAQVLTCRGQSAEAAWRELGAPHNARSRPRLRRHGGGAGSSIALELDGAGSAPHAVSA